MKSNRFDFRNGVRPKIKRFFNFRRITSAKIRFLIFGFSIAQRFNFHIGTTPVGLSRKKGGRRG